VLIALNGHNKKAQGNALGKKRIEMVAALKGRDKQRISGLFRR
jgi:hypothetical protein